MPGAQLEVRLENNPYLVSWFDEFNDIQSFVKANITRKAHGRQALITNNRLSKIYKKEIASLFPGVHVISLPDGEGQKTLATIETICDTLVKLKFDRNAGLIAFGGGVIGDITGFVAASYMRGIRFIQVPTSLLAMVDSSVGGKTGVNLKSGKNMVGAFHQPGAVLIYLPFLKTLPAREYRCGLAEAYKSALIKSKPFATYFQKNSSDIQNRNPESLFHLSYESVKIKNWVVQKDEKEKSLRAVLNLGHTLAHALESHLQYKKLKHGEAVAIGLSFAAYLSFKKKHLTRKEFEEIDETIKSLGLPRRIQAVARGTSASRLVKLMQSDKKNANDEIKFVLLDKPGRVRLAEPVGNKEIEIALKEFLEFE